ncbi:hypothetical protein N431DRAFT_452051 [Stipitochalara longipes BDJ]|nr:hypothetical protein N431DRAFT_452051 [Stipitochalara longipes BDJ]
MSLKPYFDGTTLHCVKELVAAHARRTSRQGKTFFLHSTVNTTKFPNVGPNHIATTQLLLSLRLMASDSGSDLMSMSDESEVAHPVAIPISSLSDGMLSAADQQYLTLRYPTQLPLISTIADERRQQALSYTLGANRIVWLENYAAAKDIVSAHNRAKKIQSLIDEELHQARIEYGSLGYDPLSTDLTEEQEANEKERCMAAALEIFGDAVLGTQYDGNYEYHLIATTRDEDNYEFDLTNDWFDDDLFDKPIRPEPESSPLQEQVVEVSDSTADASDANSRKLFKLTGELEVNEEEGKLISNQPKTSEKVTLQSATPLPTKYNPQQLKSTHQPVDLEKSIMQSATPLPTKVNSSKLKSTHEPKAKLQINRKEDELMSNQPTALKKGTLPRDKTVKSVFAAVHEQSFQSPRNLSKTSSAVSTSADRSRDNPPKAVQPRALAPAPVSQNILGGGPIHSVRVQVPDFQELSPRTLKHRGHQLQRSSLDNALTFENLPQNSSLPSDQAGFSPHSQNQAEANVVHKIPNPFKIPTTSTTVSNNARTSTVLPQSSALPTNRAESSPRKEYQAMPNVVNSTHRHTFNPSASFAEFYQNSLPPHQNGYRPNNQTQPLKRAGQRVTSFSGLSATTRNTCHSSTTSSTTMDPFQPTDFGSKDVTMTDDFTTTPTPKRTMSGPSATRAKARSEEPHFRPPHGIRSLPARPNVPVPTVKEMAKAVEKFPEFANNHTPPTDPKNPQEIANCTFMSLEEKLHGEHLWLGMEWYQGEFYTSWRASNPRFREMTLLRSDELSLSMEIIGPRGCGSRQALQQLFVNKYFVSTRST